MSSDNRLSIWQQGLWSRSGQQPRLSLPPSGYCYSQRKDSQEASWPEPLNEECCSFSAASELSIGESTARAGSSLLRPRQLLYGHMVQDTLFFVTGAWPGGQQRSFRCPGSGETDEILALICVPSIHILPGLGGHQMTSGLTAIHSRNKDHIQFRAQGPQKHLQGFASCG